MNKAANKKRATRLIKFFGPTGNRWANGSLAYVKQRGGRRKDNNDESCDATSSKAQSWCLLGAMQKLRMSADWLEREVNYIDANHTITASVVSFNDHDGWTPIKKLLAHIAKTGTGEGFKYPKSAL